MCEGGGTELPAIVMATSVFTATGQRPAAVTAGRGFSHSFSCILNERNQVLVLWYSVAVAHPRTGRGRRCLTTVNEPSVAFRSIRKDGRRDRALGMCQRLVLLHLLHC